jgi:hypothetical protein
MAKVKFLFIAAIIILTITSCTTIVRVETTLESTLDTTSNPEITAAKSYPDLRNLIKNVVISLPSAFYEFKSISDAKGIAKSEVLLKEAYAFWITEIEKLLTENGFRVLSRQKFEEIIREREISNIEAANLLGADAIIQVNSLEYNDAVSIKEYIKTNMKFFNTDYSGEKKQPISLDENSSNTIASMIRTQLEDFNPTAYMGLLDCKIIFAKTSELIWFYRNLIYKIERPEYVKTERTFFVQQNLSTLKWAFYDPRSFLSSKSTDKKYYDELTISSEHGGDRDTSQQIKFKIARLICEDFVNKFKSI